MSAGGAVRRAGCRAEDGSILVMVLVLVIIVSVACAAVLRYEQTGFVAQDVTVAALRKPAVAADAAIDATLAQMRYRQLQGTDGGTAELCNRTLATIADPSWSPSKTQNSNNIEYSAPADATTGIPAITVVCVPDSGSGRATNGPSMGDSYDSVVRTVGGVAGPTGVPGSAKAAVPFCDGVLPSTHTNCEVGVLIGRGTSTTEAGVTIATNGAQTPGVLVTSNSGIYVNDTGYPNPTRNFNVQSTISARFQCAGVAAQYRVNYVPPGNGQGASWNASPNLNGTGGVCKQGGPLLADPISDFKHELWQNVVTPGTTGTCAPDPTDNLWAASWSRRCGSVPLTRRSFSASDALTQCAAGLVTLAPGYYDDATGLNTLVSNSACNNVTVWLSPGTTSDPTTTSPGSRTDANDTAPGVYYFDLNGGEWGGNAKPAKFTGGNLLWIVAGTPKGWKPQTSGAQPTRYLDPQRKTEAIVSPTWAWSAPPSTAADFAAEQIDGNQATLKLPDSGTTASVSPARFGPAISQNSAVGVTGVKLRLAYDTGVPLGATAWAQLSVDVHAGTAHCLVGIPEGNQAPWEQDLTNGCPAGGLVTNGPFPGVTGTPWTPALVDSIDLSVSFKESTTTSGPRQILFNGAQLAVDTTGPPSPPFPAGCDVAKAGAQLIFGTDSHINFDNSSLPSGDGTGVFFDVCGSPGQSKYSPAIYGLTDHAGTQVCCGTVASPWYKDTSDTTIALGAQTTSNFGISGTGGTCTTVQDALRNKNDSCVLDTTGTWAAADTNDATISFTLPNNLVSDGNNQYDANATIERVEFDVTHQEGADVSKVSLSVTPPTGSGGTTWPSGITLGSAYPTDTNLPGGSLPLANAGSTADWQYGVFANSSGKVNANWPNERWTADTSVLGTPSKLNGARVTYTVSGPRGRANRWARVDRLIVRVVYRPSGTLRPLHGCMTIRPGVNWQYDDNNAAGPLGTAHTNYAPFTGTSAGGQPYMSGTDRDFAARVNSGALVSDPAYTWSSEPGSCAIVQTTGARFTVEGSVYAPTAAFDVYGKANGASFVTNTLVVRQFTETRDVNDDWSNLLGVGGARRPRSFTLYALDSNTKRLFAAVHAIIDDGAGGAIGSSVAIDSWIKRPGQ